MATHRAGKKIAAEWKADAGGGATANISPTVVATVSTWPLGVECKAIWNVNVYTDETRTKVLQQLIGRAKTLTAAKHYARTTANWMKKQPFSSMRTLR